MKPNPFLTAVPMLLGLTLCSHAETIVTGDVTANLGPDFFFDTAVIGGGDFTVNQPGLATFNRPFGTLNVGAGGSTITITGIGWASANSSVNNDATSATVTITYLGQDGAFGGGDDVVIGVVTDNFTFAANGEYYWKFTTPISRTIDGLNNLFRVSIAPNNDLSNGSLSFKTSANNPNGNATNVKLSVAGTSAAAEALPDDDSDGIPNIYETGGDYNGGLGTLGTYNGPFDTGTFFNLADSDGDTIPDGEENNSGIYLSATNTGTNPTKIDTDGDGFNDGIETNSGFYNGPTDPGTNPNLIDTDGDTINDNFENDSGTYHGPTDTGTNPNLIDSDYDGLNDNLENNSGTYASPTNPGTDPNRSDTDSDGLTDGWEVANGTDPHVADDTANPDNDDLDNFGEQAAGTNPHDPDSDNDGLTDGIEANFLAVGYTATNPLNRDSDNDGLGDKFEIDNGLDAMADADFDNDTYTDFDEVMLYGSDPKLATSFPGDGIAPAVGSLTPIINFGPVGVNDHLPLPPMLGDPAALSSAVVNEAAQGGNDLQYNTGITNFTVVYPNALPAARSATSITGFAWVVPGAGYVSGDIRVEFYDPEAADADLDFDGVDAETFLGAATGTLTFSAVTGISYWAFDAPINFTSAGTSLAVRILGAESLRLKAASNIASGIRYSNQGGGQFATDTTVRLTLFGTAVGPGQPRILDLTRSGTTTTINWTLGAAPAVDLERSTDLGNSDPWTKVLTGTTNTTYTETSSDPRAFFRLATP